VAAIETEGRTGKNPRAYLTFEQEAAISRPHGGVWVYTPRRYDET